MIKCRQNAQRFNNWFWYRFQVGTCEGIPKYRPEALESREHSLIASSCPDDNTDLLPTHLKLILKSNFLLKTPKKKNFIVNIVFIFMYLAFKQLFVLIKKENYSEMRCLNVHSQENISSKIFILGCFSRNFLRSVSNKNNRSFRETCKTVTSAQCL